jgi:hypothetical protein
VNIRSACKRIIEFFPIPKKANDRDGEKFRRGHTPINQNT